MTHDTHTIEAKLAKAIEARDMATSKAWADYYAAIEAAMIAAEASLAVEDGGDGTGDAS